MTGLANLTMLDLRNNAIEDISPLEGMNIANLRLEGNPGSPITFADTHLEAAIREAIGKPEGDLLVEDVVGLTFLDASGRNIQSLEGMEHLTNLTQLELNNNAIVDLSPLAGLTNLTELSFASTSTRYLLSLIHI